MTCLMIPQINMADVAMSKVVSGVPLRTRRVHRATRKHTVERKANTNRKRKKPEKINAWHTSVYNEQKKYRI